MVDRIKEIFKRIPLHPFLWALFPLISYLANNLGEIRLSQAARPALVVLMLVILGFAVARLLGRTGSEAAYILTFTFLAFLSYGQIYEGLKFTFLAETGLVRHRFVAPALAAVVLLLIYLANKVDRKELNRSFTLVALILLLFPIGKIAAFSVDNWSKSRPDALETACELPDTGKNIKRDVYLFILDAYARDDVLRELHHFDNEPFLDGLRDQGFVIAEGSLSNYRHTEMSLSSLLSMEYLQDIPGSYQQDSQNRMGLVSLIQNSRVRRDFECLGYDIVSFESGVFWTQWEDADHYFSRERDPLERMALRSTLTRFEAGWLETTGLRLFQDLIILRSSSSADLVRSSDEEQRDLFRFVFDNIDQAAAIEGPKFVFIHVLSPHPPFIFGREGEPVGLGRFEDSAEGLTDEDLLAAYVDQLIYLNSQVETAVDQILNNSTPSPIIIIMGDHGWADRNAEDKLSILNAYHLPEGGGRIIYPTITPVNTFRAIFDFYFEAGMGFLPDSSYFSTEDDVYDFEEVSNSWPPE